MKIGIVGCAGRMGRMLVRTVLTTPGCALAGGTERPDSDAIGEDLTLLSGGEPSGLLISADTPALFKASDAVIDFTQPGATAVHAGLAAEHGSALIVGTTGLDASHMAVLSAAAKKIAVVKAANFSVGINLLLGLAKKAASVLGDDYDIEIVEMHHRHKVDAPSGTALALGEAAAAGRKVDLAKVSQRVRDGHTGARRRGDIGFATLRGGDVVGDHSVIFAADGERVEISHRASSRAIFAQGAVRAALWTESKKPGLYSMQDVLGFV